VGDYFAYAGAAAFLSTPSDLVQFGMGINNGPCVPAPSSSCRRRSEASSGAGPDTASAGMSNRFHRTTHADGRPWQPGLHRRHDSSPNVSRTADRRRGDVEYSHADTKSIALDIAQAFATETIGGIVKRLLLLAVLQIALAAQSIEGRGEAHPST
jgi:hypothetical protein